MGDASLAGPVRGAASPALAEACANEAGDAASIAARIVAPGRRIALLFMTISWQRSIAFTFVEKNPKVHRESRCVCTRAYGQDGRDGTVLGRFDDRAGTLGDQIRIWQFPLHSGQGFGMPGRVVICAAGALPLVLATSGAWLWLRRRRVRVAMRPERAGKV